LALIGFKIICPSVTHGEKIMVLNTTHSFKIFHTDR
jgi:hypothetical protein